MTHMLIVSPRDNQTQWAIDYKLSCCLFSLNSEINECSKTRPNPFVSNETPIWYKKNYKQFFSTIWWCKPGKKTYKNTNWQSLVISSRIGETIEHIDCERIFPLICVARAIVIFRSDGDCHVYVLILANIRPKNRQKFNKTFADTREILKVAERVTAAVHSVRWL